ncbi:unnamed protein product [Ambrosiozyma monospora]|uniref:Unnamed protein product n=1 Tax=Ambrosiozyma monospora TaxID=43982 RepID=A0ACB5SR98_AMBMO|nr:unnamed protein product [Ambrosiozyma monospora]
MSGDLLNSVLYVVKLLLVLILKLTWENKLRCCYVFHILTTGNKDWKSVDGKDVDQVESLIEEFMASSPVREKVNMVMEENTGNGKKNKRDKKFRKGGKGKFQGDNKKNGFVCYNCGKVGHIANDCRYQKKKLEKVNVAVRQEKELIEKVRLSFDSMDDDPKLIAMDGASSTHIINDKSKFKHLSKCHTRIDGLNGSLVSEWRGDCYLKSLLLKDAVYCPNAPVNLVSVSKLDEDGMTVIYGNKKVKVLKDNDEVLPGNLKVDGLYYIDETEKAQWALVGSSSGATDEELYNIHVRAAHASVYQMRKLTADKIPWNRLRKANKNCTVWKGDVKKSHGKPDKSGETDQAEVENEDKDQFEIEGNGKFQVGEMLVMDIIGPINGTYGLVMKDVGSQFIKVKVLKSKSEASSAAISLIKEFKNQLKRFDLPICFVRSDNEFDTSAIANFCDEEGYDFQPTAPGHSYQNGSAENANGFLERKMRKMLNQFRVPMMFWGHAFEHAAYLHNIMPKKNSPSPYAIFHRTLKKIDASKLIPFGSRVFIRNPNEKQKVGKTFSAGIFLGYDKTLKIIKYWKVKTRRVGRTADFRVDNPIVFPLVKIDDTNLLDINFDDSGTISSSISYGGNFGFGRVSGGSVSDGSNDPDIQDVEMNSPPPLSPSTSPSQLLVPIQQSNESRAIVQNVPDPDGLNPVESMDIDKFSAAEPVVPVSQVDNQVASYGYTIEEPESEDEFFDASEHGPKELPAPSTISTIHTSSKSLVPSTKPKSTSRSDTMRKFSRALTLTKSKALAKQDNPQSNSSSSSTALVPTSHQKQLTPNPTSNVVTQQSKKRDCDGKIKRQTTALAPVRRSLRLQHLPPQYVPEDSPVSHKLVPYNHNQDNNINKINDDKSEDPDHAIVSKTKKSNDGEKIQVVYEKLTPTNVNDPKSLPSTVKKLLGYKSESTMICVEQGKYNIPTSFDEMMKSPQWLKWLEGLDSENDSLRKNNVYKFIKIEDVPKDAKIVTGKYVCSVKVTPEKKHKGKIIQDRKEQFKVRLVAKGFMQRLGESYIDAFAPVSSFDSFRFIMSYGAMNNWYFTQLAAKTAFLNGKLYFPVYFKPPKGSGTDTSRYIWLLKRSLYGLVNSSNV